MIRLTDQAAIRAAELRVARARLNLRASLARVRITTRKTLARPSTLLGIAVAAGLLSYCLAPKAQPIPAPSSGGVATAAKTSAFGLVLAFVVRYGMQYLPDILRHAWAMHQERAAHGGPH
jgi:hypothetical protein